MKKALFNFGIFTSICFYILCVEFCKRVIVYHEDSSDADFHLKVGWTFLHCLNYSQTFNAYTILYSMLYKKYEVFKYILLLASWLLHDFSASHK